MFKKTSDALLALSIALSVKTICFVTLKSVTILKTFLPFKTKFFLMLWIIVSSSARVMSIVFFFIPSFGLLSILGHWKLEQTPYSEEIKARFEKNNTVYLYNSKPVAWTDLCRYNYTSDSGPDYTVYTYYTLQEYLCGFWILLFLHVLLNAMAKILCSEDFRTNGTSSLLYKLVHCVENTNVPTLWVDGTISNLQIFFGKLTNCQTTFCQPSFYPPFILPNFFCANLQFTKYILPNLHFLDFWKTYKFPSFCQTFILPNLHFAKPFSL